MSSLVAIILLVVFVALVVLVVTQSIRIVPQAMAGIVERFGRYHRTLHAGLNMVTPFADRLRPLLEFDPAGVGHAGLEGWLTGGGGSVHDGAVGHGEGGSVPRTGDAGAAPLHDDPSLVQGPAEVRAPV
jgi:hypothetical protein